MYWFRNFISSLIIQNTWGLELIWAKIIFSSYFTLESVTHLNLQLNSCSDKIKIKTDPFFNLSWVLFLTFLNPSLYMHWATLFRFWKITKISLVKQFWSFIKFQIYVETSGEGIKNFRYSHTFMHSISHSHTLFIHFAHFLPNMCQSHHVGCIKEVTLAGDSTCGFKKEIWPLWRTENPQKRGQRPAVRAEGTLLPSVWARIYSEKCQKRLIL